jgi:predicted ATPase/class 3 adenylate cyclase
VPAGTVAFLLTDVEGSTALWEREPDAMAAAMARHYWLVDECVSTHGGVRPQEQGEGDSVVAAFARASEAILAARDLQGALTGESWPTARPLRVRMAVHAGEARLRDAVNYAGEAIIRTARLRAIGHGGQVLVSQAARDLAVDLLGDAVELIALGTHRLKDLARPEQVWQLRAEGLPDGFGPLASLDAVPNNLPSSLSKFIGRTEEIATVVRVLDADRLVTLTGAGGAGKSRLALQVAAEVVDRFGDGVWWVELAPITTSEDVALAIAAAMGVPDPGRGEPLQRLAALIGKRAPLLAVDNAEHLVDEVARIVSGLLAKCPHLRLMVTSRRPLEVAGEVTYRVPSLSCPSVSDRPLRVAALDQYDAVDLFVDRARRVRPGFALSDTNAAAVADICARLDGLPLAIELAAARCRSLSHAQVRTGLADSLRLLHVGSRTVLPRQQTLEASIAWSHDLLGDRERAVLRRLAVFHGGWTLAAAEQVVADEQLVGELEVLDVVDRLVQHSLVQVDDDAGVASRYRMLETVRQFGVHQLRAAGELDDLRVRHSRWVLALLQQFSAWAIDERLYDIWWALEPEQANIDAAIGALHERGDHTAVAEALVGIADWVTGSRRYALGVRWSESAVQDQPRVSSSVVARFLEWAGVGRALQGRYGDAFPLLQRARQLAEERDDPAQLLRLDVWLSMSGLVLLTPGSEQTALANLDRARSSPVEWWRSWSPAG